MTDYLEDFAELAHAAIVGIGVVVSLALMLVGAWAVQRAVWLALTWVWR